MRIRRITIQTEADALLERFRKQQETIDDLLTLLDSSRLVEVQLSHTIETKERVIRERQAMLDLEKRRLKEYKSGIASFFDAIYGKSYGKIIEVRVDNGCLMILPEGAMDYLHIEAELCTINLPEDNDNA